MKQNIEQFLHFISDENFLEAHEILENDWRKYKNTPSLREESFLIKGLINGATALALHQIGRVEPAKRVWETFLKYEPLLASIQSQYMPYYQQAQELLHVKYKKLITCKNI